MRSRPSSPAFAGAPGKAIGGPVTPGRAYLVGERGPELFVPTASGRVETRLPGGREIRMSIIINAPPGAAAGRSANRAASWRGRSGRRCSGSRIERWHIGWRRRARRGREGFVKRFDARFWTVDFPRPMMASVVTTGPDALRIEAVFYRADDLAGLIWAAEDRWDHRLLAYETARDFRRCRLTFRWRSGGIKALDAVDGPTLTIEGRDAAGAPRSWYVRLWNYADGTNEDAAIDLDFGALAGGWAADDPVWAGDIDRLFVSLVAPGYDASDAPLAEPAEGWAELSDIACDGSGSVLAIGEVDRARAPASDRDRI